MVANIGIYLQADSRMRLEPPTSQTHVNITYLVVGGCQCWM